MGNSNSAQHDSQHQQQPLQWSQSLDPPDSRNRMKKGYFPPRHYIGHGHGGMVPPQKVLPTVNPAKAALRLKPTSNGAILHGGGTISGRKLQLLNELHEANLGSSPQDDRSLQINTPIRKRNLSASSINGGGGSVIDPGEAVDVNSLSGVASTPNLPSMDFHASDFSRRSQRSISGHTIIFDKGSSYKGGSGIATSSGRDYDSEPDMRDGGITESIASTMGDRSMSPLPNSFTLISESPAKKQIRTKKKYQAPPPPPENMITMISPNGRPYHHDPMMDPHLNNMNEFDPNIHRASTNSNSSGAGPAGGKKKLTRLFKTKAQSKISSATALASHQKQQESHDESDERRILAESIMEQVRMSPSVKNKVSGSHISYSNNNSSSQWTRDSYNSQTSCSNRSIPSHVGMTTTSTEQLEKFRHHTSTTHNMHQTSMNQSQMTEQQQFSSSAEGRRLSSMSTELAAAAAALGKKKSFDPLCSTKENRDSLRGGALQTQASSSHQQQQLPYREVVSGGEPLATTMTPSAVSQSHNQLLLPSHNVKTSYAAHSQARNSQSHQQHSISTNANNNQNNNKVPYTQSSAQGFNANRHKRENENDNDGATKKTFYFGMDMGTSTSAVQEILLSQSKEHTQGQHEQTSSDPNIAITNNNKRVFGSSVKPRGPHHIIDKIKNNKSPPSPVGSPQEEAQQVKAEKFMNMTQRKNDSISKQDIDNQISNNTHNNHKPSNVNNRNLNEFPFKNNTRLGQKLSANLRTETELTVTMQSNTSGNISSALNYGNGQMNPNKILNLPTQSSDENVKQYPSPPPLFSSKNNSNSNNVISSQHLSRKNKTSQIDQSPRSDSDSDGFQQQLIQQYKNMKLRQSKKKSEPQLTGTGVLNIGDDSSSDLSSSEVDIPLLIRPTLPQRRLDLPRFSPSAAWRALDSPRASGCSLSSEDGFSYEDRIQRYTRPSAPPRNNNERSGDSGISAGDAGSPANAPDMGGRTSNFSYSHSNHNINNPESNNKLRNNKLRGSSPVKTTISDAKCWTPEQDLDESSSEFEHDVELSSPHVGDGLGSYDDTLDSDRNDLSNLVPVGVQTPPKFTTRSQLFAKNRSSSPAFTSKVNNHKKVVHKNNNITDSGINNRSNGSPVRNDFTSEPQSLQDHNLQRQHRYTRSTKINQNSSMHSNNTSTTNNNSVGNHSSIVEINQNDDCSDLNSRRGNRIAATNFNNLSGGRKLSRRPQNERRQFEYDQEQYPSFVGLDTNWFLSRSEPNLFLRSQDITLESSSNHHQLSRRIHPRLSVMQELESPVSNEPLDLLDKVFPTRTGKVDHHQRQQKSSGYMKNDSLHFDREVDDSMAHDEEQFNENDNGLIMMGNSEVRSEIGYGPSSMNFYTSYTNQKHQQQQQQPTNSTLYDDDSKANSLILSRRPFSFSHIMYLPSYDSRRLHPPATSSSSHHYPNNRRTKSVDNLDSSSQLKLFRPSNSNSNLSNSNDYFDSDAEQHHQRSSGNQRSVSPDFQHQSRSRVAKSKFDQNYSTKFNYTNQSQSNRNVGVENLPFNFSRSQSVPGPRVIEHKIIQEQESSSTSLNTQAKEHLDEKNSHEENLPQHHRQQHQQELDQEKKRQLQLNEKKKKFKFQSTLRVLERKKIEKELTREAEEKEMQRLREIESMRRVEEEFQKKRAHKEQAIELTGLKDNHSKTEAGQFEEWNDLRLNGSGGNNNSNTNHSKNSDSHNPTNKNIVKNWCNQSSTGENMTIGSGSGSGSCNTRGSERHFLNSNQVSNDNSCGDGGGAGGRSSSATSGSIANSSSATTVTVSTNNSQLRSGSGSNTSGSRGPNHLIHQRLSSSSSTPTTLANHQHHNDNNIHSSMSNSNSSTSNNHGNNLIMSNSKLLLMAQRQEPEGAPAFSTTSDLRKERLHASKKWSGAGNTNNNGINNHGPQHQRSGSSELTHELSEYRQETRQYCDYRRSPRTNSASPARFAESSNSDIFPLSRRTPVERSMQNRYRSTVHPEVVCDIPGKPFPFMINYTRLSGSTSNLVVDDRPGSGLGFGGGNVSGPSSIISDNYRRDWAHHIRGSNHGGPGRASSVASLHSAPGFTTDHLRHSCTDLTIPADSPRVIHKSRKSPLFQKYSNSPPSSPPPPLSSNISEITDLEKDGSSIMTSTIGPPSGVFQLQPFNKPKGYRPVAFKPTPASNHAIKLTSTTVN